MISVTLPGGSPLTVCLVSHPVLLAYYDPDLRFVPLGPVLHDGRMTAAESARQRHNVLVRHHGRDDPRTIEAARDLRVERIAAVIARDTGMPLCQAREEADRMVAWADAQPPPTAQRRTRLAAMLSDWQETLFDLADLDGDRDG